MYAVFHIIILSPLRNLTAKVASCNIHFKEFDIDLKKTNIHIYDKMHDSAIS